MASSLGPVSSTKGIYVPKEAGPSSTPSFLNRTITLRSFVLFQITLTLLIVPYFVFQPLKSSAALELKTSTSGSHLVPHAKPDLSLRTRDNDLGDAENDEFKSFPISNEIDAQLFAVQQASSGQKMQVFDPLDDNIFLEGFPLEPLTIQTANLCDEEKNIIFKDSWRCKEDITCSTCTEKVQEKFKELNDAFNSPELLEQRKQLYAKRFVPENNGLKSDMILPVFGVNFGQLYLFLNWACTLKLRIGMDPTKLAVLVPTDVESYDILIANGFFAIDPKPWNEKLSVKISPTYSGHAMSGDHSRINNIILFVVNELVQLGYGVIVHDVDVVWNRDILPYLTQSGLRRDLLGQLAPYWNAKGTINSGFIYIRPSRKSKMLVQSLVNLAPLKKTSDQELWNTVLRHYYFGQVNYRILPQSIFYKYSGHRAQQPDMQKMLAFHAVGNAKRTHIASAGLWYMTEKCPYYNKRADEESKAFDG